MPVGTSGGGGGSSGAIRAGGAFVELFGKDRLSPTLNKVQLRLASFGKFINSVGSSALRAGSVLLAPVAALFAGTLAKSKEGVFGPEAQAHAQRFSDAWARAILGLQRGLLPVVELLAPVMEMLASITQRNSGVVLLIAGVGAGLLALGVAAKAVGAAMTLASVAVGAVKLAVLALSSPLLLIVGGIVAFAASFANWGSLFGKLKDTGEKAIGGVIAAFQSGQLELAGQIALASLKLAWLDTIEFMKETLRAMLKTITDLPKLVKAAFPAFALLADFLAGREFLKPDEAGRAKLTKELADLLKQVKKAEPAGRVPPSLAAEATRGLFQSPDFARALAFGPGVKVQDRIAAAAERQVALLGDISGKLDKRAAFA